MRRRILVTGGSRGIGFAIAGGSAAAGHAVTSVSRQAPPTTPGLAHLACDLRSPSSIRAALSDWLERSDGPLDALVHCAVAYGSDGRRPLVATTFDEWEQAMTTNARGLLLVLQAVLPHMVQRGQGLIVCISSDVAGHPGPGRIPYAASKAAAHAIMTGLAEEIDGSGVSVVELVPTGQVDTPGIRSRRPIHFTGPAMRTRGLSSPRSCGS